jgi:fatty acid desaturase
MNIDNLNISDKSILNKKITVNYNNLLPKLIIYEWSSINSYITIFHIVIEWILIILLISISINNISSLYIFLIYPLTVVFIGARQHALAALMHEGSHYLLISNKKINDIISEILIAWPLFISMQSYRSKHLLHHRFVNTNKDPDWVRKQTTEWSFPKTKIKLFIVLLKDLFALNTISLLARLNKKRLDNPSRSNSKNNFFLLARIFYYMFVFSLISYFNIWWIFWLYWIVPAFTWFQFIARIRSISEHFAIDYNHPLRQSRSTKINILEKILIVPKNLNYHLEHHLYPTIPFYKLEKLHQELMQSEEFCNNAHITHDGYWGVLQECVGRCSMNKKFQRSSIDSIKNRNITP